MKLQSTLLTAFALLFAAVSAERYQAILRFLPAPRIYPPPYFTLIEFPEIGKKFYARFWQDDYHQDLTKGYYGAVSLGYVDVNDLSAFDGRYPGVINDDTKQLRIQIEGNGQTLTFVGESATEREVKNLIVRADVAPEEDNDYRFEVQSKANGRSSYHQSHVQRLNEYYEYGLY
ncbi:hypothetical protein EC973_003666 [Apophysomyces ossiformis]|uniref:Uncharacterized protein n=1 Tax=Apophysomyces ossiformis TaxID=679940 RepID=A0A8H7EMZ3_9FUNG|nr:hypothetical protein EC973_003666 [Apophysomyces ossiformis]